MFFFTKKIFFSFFQEPQTLTTSSTPPPPRPSPCAPPPLLQICDVLRADGLVYQDVDDLLEVGMGLNPNIKKFDAACFDGHYVTGEVALVLVGCWGWGSHRWLLRAGWWGRGSI